MTQTSQTALILGGGMGGMLAAWVLAEDYEQVLLFEPDAPLGAYMHRKGTPQAQQVHRLLPGGHLALEQLFPGFGAELEARGALRNYQGFEAASPLDTAPYFGYYCTRRLVEQLIWQRVSQLKNLSLIQAKAAEICWQGQMATGILTQQKQYYEGQIIVDATGNDQLLRQVLRACEQVGYTQRLCGLKYASCILGRTKHLPEQRENMFIHPQVDSSYGALLIPVEGQRWLCTLSSYYQDLPPQDWPSFLQRLSKLASQEIFAQIQGEEFLEGVHLYAYSRSYRYELGRAKHLPQQYLPLGDVLCKVNPLNGQGVSMVAKQALFLRTYLQNSRAAFPDLVAYYQGLSTLTEAAWYFSLPHDLAYTLAPEVSPADRQVLVSLALLDKACRFDAEARQLKNLALAMVSDDFQPQRYLQARMQADMAFKTQLMSQLWF